MVQQMTACINWLSQHCKTTNPTTALSQLIVADRYNGVTINAKGYDVVASDGRKIQVKGRWWPSKPSGPSGSWSCVTLHFLFTNTKQKRLLQNCRHYLYLQALLTK